MIGKLYLIAVFICISLVSSNVEHLSKSVIMIFSLISYLLVYS